MVEPSRWGDHGDHNHGHGDRFEHRDDTGDDHDEALVTWCDFGDQLVS